MPEANAKPAVNPAASTEVAATEDTTSNNGQSTAIPVANDEDTKSSMASSTMDEDSQPGKTEEEVPSSESLPATEPPAEEAPAPAETVTTMNEEKTTTNGNTPKTNGNNSHNGSEQPKNGEEDKAKDIIEDQPKNGELENGVVSTETWKILKIFLASFSLIFSFSRQIKSFVYFQLFDKFFLQIQIFPSKQKFCLFSAF